MCIISFLGVLGSACAEADAPLESEPENEAVFQEKGGAQDGPVLDLPFVSGSAHMCVQGVNGTYSHSHESTRYDLDLDTGNDEDEAVFAAANGLAYAHGTADDVNGFGLHVNIDLGDGTYVTIAHLKEVFIEDGEGVVSGQLIGVEGCSGACQGDHVHFGRHRGDATQDAGQGTSIAARYRVANASGDEQVLSSEDFVCGIKQAGDPQDGLFYTSLLPDTKRYPNGTLVKVPDSPDVYLIDDGQLRVIENESVFYSYNYQFSDVVTISKEALRCYDVGDSIATEGVVRAAHQKETGDLWLLTGTNTQPTRQKVAKVGRGAVLKSWGIHPEYTSLPTLSANDAFFDHPIVDGAATMRDGTLVTEYSTSDVYVVVDGVAVPILGWSVYLKTGFFGRDIIVVDDGIVSQLQGVVGDCSRDGVCIDFDYLESCGSRIDMSGYSENGSDEDTEMSTEGESDDSSNENIGRKTFQLRYDSDEHLAVHSLSLFGQARNADDQSVLQWQELASARGEDVLAWGTDDLQSGDHARFAIRANDMSLWFLSCDQLQDHGFVDVLFEGERIAVDYISLEESGECRVEVHLPLASANNDTPDESQDVSSSDDSTESVEEPQRILLVEWVPPFQQTVPEIVMSGEYLTHDGHFGFPWQVLQSVQNTNRATYQLSGVESGDRLRFSVEFEDTIGNISWSCIHDPGPPEQFVPQGDVFATVDGQSVATELVGDPRPNEDGCGYRVTIP